MKKIIKKILFFFIRKMLEIKNRTIKIEYGASVNIHSKFEGKNVICRNTSFSGEIGRCSYIGPLCGINAKIGRYCCIGSNVETISSRHPTDTFVSISPMFYSTDKKNGYTYVTQNYYEEMVYADQEKHSVIIGNDVWIGSHVLIMGGVTIGDGAIIAAGAVVTSDVEPYSIVGGVPAKLLRYRFSENDRKALLKDRWWDKDEQRIRKHAHLFIDISNYVNEIENERKSI